MKAVESQRPEQDIGPILLPHEKVGIVVNGDIVPLEDWLEEECVTAYKQGHREAGYQYNALFICTAIVLIQIFIYIATQWVRPIIFIGP